MERYLNLLKGRNRSILMGLSLLWIMAFHLALYGNLLRFPAVNFLFGKGYLGVDVFFFLSAYGLCYSFNENSVKEYYKRRVFKLFPMYIIFIAILLLAFPATRGNNWLKVFIFQISGLSTFAKLDIEWFIPALIVLYMLLPLLYKAIKWIYDRGIYAVAALIIALSLICPILSRFIFYLFAFRLVIIVLGIISYLALRDGNMNCLMLVYALSALIGILFMGTDRLNVGMTGSLLVPLLFFTVSQVEFAPFKLRLIPFIGKHSLEIYLAQCLAFNHFMAASKQDFIPTVCISVGIIVVLSVVLFYVQSLSLRLVVK